MLKLRRLTQDRREFSELLKDLEAGRQKLMENKEEEKEEEEKMMILMMICVISCSSNFLGGLHTPTELLYIYVLRELRLVTVNKSIYRSLNE